MAFAVARPGFDVAGIDTVVVGWLIDEDTKSELRGQWQQAVLDLAFAWVVRDLDGIEATRHHRRLELAEARRLPMRCADEGHLTRVADLLDAPQPLGPANHVVDLQQLDVAAVERQRCRDLTLSHLVVVGPHFGGNHRP